MGPATVVARSHITSSRMILAASRWVSKVAAIERLLSAGIGSTFVAVTSAAVAGVPQADAGVASALLDAGQQIGGALGLAILTAVSSARTEALAPAGPPGTPTFVSALADGWGAGFLVAAGFLAAADAVAVRLVGVTEEQAASALKDAGPAAG